jgi:hypothetical protein
VEDEEGVDRPQPAENRTFSRWISKNPQQASDEKYPPGERRKKENYDFLPQ